MLSLGPGVHTGRCQVGTFRLTFVPSSYDAPTSVTAALPHTDTQRPWVSLGSVTTVLGKGTY